jgi:hypothetical protein
MSNSHEGFEKLRTKIIVRAWKDPSFRKKLLKNPRAAIKEMGFNVPENLEIHVVEDKAGSLTFVLPPSTAQTKQLSDRELELLAAAGGDSMNCHTNYAPVTTCDPCMDDSRCHRDGPS